MQEDGLNQEERLKEIIKIAKKLGWIYPPNKTSYPLMQLSEVEKCMMAMVDDDELERLRKWYKEKGKGRMTFANMVKEIYNWSEVRFKQQLMKAVGLSKEEAENTKLLKITSKDADVLLDWSETGKIKETFIDLLKDGLIVFTERDEKIIPVRVIDLYFGEKDLGIKILEEGD